MFKLSSLILKQSVKSSASNFFVQPTQCYSQQSQKFTKILCANRGEIATRVFRAGTELGLKTVAVYSFEDRKATHKFKADEAYIVGKGLAPVAAYLNIDEVIRVAKETGAQAIHPGYGFLSESAPFALRCEQEGIQFIGPKGSMIDALGHKTAARELAEKAGVPTVPGSKPLNDWKEAKAFADKPDVGYPIILKAALGGGGRGMRVVNKESELQEAFTRCKSEAVTFFGDGTVFAEKYLSNPRHIEVQILADNYGNVIHLYERDCSVQRRHQKVVEIAPGMGVTEDLRQRLCGDAVKLAKEAKYRNAGTFEFLVELGENPKYYFIEVNPRVQVEHTCTEEITGVDIVQSQIRIAQGESLADIGFKSQEDVPPLSKWAIQCRITTENPRQNFQPDTGIISVYRTPGGAGIRLDGEVHAGTEVSPHYDSMLVKCISSDRTFPGAVRKMRRALEEFRIRGVNTNIPFVKNVLSNEAFLNGAVHTRFVDDTPSLFNMPNPRDRATLLLNYLGDVIVNGTSVMGADPNILPSAIDPLPISEEELVNEYTNLPKVGEGHGAKLREIYKTKGAEAFAKAVREHKGALITDTTWRDAHQSLLATRVRTQDLLEAAPFTRRILSNAYSLEMWGGATFDVSMRFLHECPWERLIKLREAVPDIPFQMLLRGANGVGYTSYPDNVVHKFCKNAVASGMDVFRVFDSLNYMDNLQLGIDAVGGAGGIVEAAICYTGDISDPNSDATKYSLDYYMDLTRKVVKAGTHVLAIKDMAGLLKPQAAKMLISRIREEFPNLPIHVHTHDSSGCGVASMLASIEAGADVVDAAIDSMSGTTSQPSMGAIVAALEHSNPTGLDLLALTRLNDYWEELRGIYSPFESGQKTGSSDVYYNEIPGGQYTNLLFQSKSLGLSGMFAKVKKAYTQANIVLGNLIKVTPSSKVVGDLAQFMVQNNISSAAEVLEQAETLSFPQSVIDFLRGDLGEPVGGFPEPFRTKVLSSRNLKPIVGRPGASMPDFDFDKLHKELHQKYPAFVPAEKSQKVENDLLSSVMYPKVFDEFIEFQQQYGNVTVLPTRNFISGLLQHEEISFNIENGKNLIVKLVGVAGQVNGQGKRQVFFELNGMPRTVFVSDKNASANIATFEKANPSNIGSVGAPMPGELIEVLVAEGQEVARGDKLVVLSAMKMETVVSAPCYGTIKRITVKRGDQLSAGDLLIEIDEQQFQALPKTS